MSAKTWLQIIAGIIILGTVGTVIFLALPTIEKLAPFLGIVIVVTVAIAVPGTLLGFAYYLYSAAQIKRLQARVVKPNANNAYGAMWIEAERRFVQPQNGALPNVVPQTYSPQIHNHNDVKEFMKILEMARSQEQLQIAAPENKPTIDELMAGIERNSLELPLGRSLQTKQPIVIELIDAHIKLIGGSRMGKSCEAGAILDMARQTHDNKHLLLAILDLENKTGRLFDDDNHILIVNTGYKHVKMHARSVAEVAACIIVLHDLMMDRYAMSEQDQERQAHVLIYLEEFLYWKKLLGQFVDKDTRKKALDAFSGIATRGIKVGLHLMACAQVDYADEELRDAMAQFLAVNVAFSVKPEAARAAGFVDSVLLKKNYQDRKPGQFVVEAINGSDLGIAPDYDVRAKLKALSGVVVDADVSPQDRYQTRVSEETAQTMPELQPNYSRTTGRIETDPAIQAKVAQVMSNPGENMNDCIKRVWNAHPGDNNKYKQAKQEYIQVQEIIHSMARRGMQSYQSSEMESE